MYCKTNQCPKRNLLHARPEYTYSENDNEQSLKRYDQKLRSKLRSRDIDIGVRTDGRRD